MKYASVTDRLAGLGSAKWDVHLRALSLRAAGRDIIALTIGNPDVPTPPGLIDTAAGAMVRGRTQYSNGRGEENLVAALARRYSASAGRPVTAANVLCFPGTQTALYAVIMGLAEAGCEVLAGDPMYATYEGIVAASGASLVPVPLRPEAGFRIRAGDIALRITPRSRVILLNSPHNPTGAVLGADDIAAIGALARAHDLWIVVDEVYEELVFEGTAFTSALTFADLADRVVVVSSISKSHAAPGFRSGWCIGPAEFTDRVQALSETMLFGNQPFIADMTAAAVAAPSAVAAGMRTRFARRADYLAARLKGTVLRVHRPEAGMFTMIDVAATGLDGLGYALDLLDRQGVAVMPGASFGTTLDTWARVALTVDDATLARACDRIIAHAEAIRARGAA